MDREQVTIDEMKQIVESDPNVVNKKYILKMLEELKISKYPNEIELYPDVISFYTDYHVQVVYMKTTCKGGCGKVLWTNKPSTSQWRRSDWHGIYTGCYCDDCYNSESYPYRKDNYAESAMFEGETIYEEDY